MERRIKQCSKCKETKPLSEFHKNKRTSDGLQFQCKQCSHKSYRAKYESTRVRNEACAVCGKEMTLQTGPGPAKKYCSKQCQMRSVRWSIRYDITVDQYREMWNRQTGACAICQLPGEYGKLNVDHDHVTGAVRGLLCNSCNTGLGRFEDDPARLGRAIDYLKGG